MSQFSNNGLYVQEYVYDFSVDGGATGFIDLSAKAGSYVLPQGAIVTGVVYNVDTAMTSAGSATVAIGDAASGTAYVAATAFDNGAYAANTPVLDATLQKINSANKGKFGVTIAAAALTAGKIFFGVQYMLPSK